MKEPNPYDYDLLESDVGRAALAVERGKRINRYAAWLCFLLGALGGLALGHFFGVLLGVGWFFGLMALGIHISDSKQLVKFWNYNDRHVIDGYYQYEMAKIHYKRWLDKTRREYWASLSGREFEYEIAALFRSHGYQARVTPASGDKGVDIILSSSGKVIVVQCKRYKRPAGPATARELYGALLDSNADEAIFVCTAGFTSGVHEFVQDKPIRLMDLEDILYMQQEVSSPTETESIVPFQIWAQTRLKRASISHKKIKEALGSYIDEYDLLSSDLDEPEDIATTRVRCVILEQSVEHFSLEIRECVEEHLNLLQEQLELMEEREESYARMERRIEKRRTEKNIKRSLGHDESLSEWDRIQNELDRIHYDMKAGVLSGQEAAKQLDHLGEEMERIEIEEAEKEVERLVNLYQKGDQN